MTHPYTIATNQEDPTVQIQLPEKIVQDLVLRAEENGRHIEVEIALRLVRTLERDLDRLVEDEVMQAILDNRLQSRWG